MHQRLAHRHSIFCIMPPHLLRLLAQTGEEEERTDAGAPLGPYESTGTQISFEYRSTLRASGR
jgi:hypothetical protein